MLRAADAVAERADALDFDLDIDVLVAPDYSCRVLDEDEFDAHERLYGYPPEFRRRARQALEEIDALVRARRFPFGEWPDEAAPRSGAPVA